MKDNRLYLINIKECIEQIKSYTIDGKEAFLQIRMIQDAVIRNFEVIGEATKRLSLDFREKYPNIPWQQMAGFRDILIHDYLKVNVNRVWGVVEQNLPELKAAIEIILQEDL